MSVGFAGIETVQRISSCWATRARILLIGGVFLTSCRERSINLRSFEGDSRTLAVSIDSFARITGRIPTTSQGLDALIRRPADLPAEVPWSQVMTRMALDQWKCPYVYEAIGPSNPTAFSIRSLGQDGVRSMDDELARFTTGEFR